MTENNSNYIRVYKEKLYGSKEEKIEQIIEYFNGFNIDYKELDNYFLIKLNRSDFTYCEDMSKGFKDLLITEKECNDYCIIEKNFCVCLSEAWIPYAWSKLTNNKCKPKNLTIIHIDDHSDLMSPFIKKYNGNYIDMITNKVIDFSNPLSVLNSVKSGAITIGSILTPIVFDVDDIKILHLKQNAIKEYKNIIKTTIYDDFINNSKRISVNLDHVQKIGFDNIYLKTNNWDDIYLELDFNSDIIVHIDMDYFNNRYNGSTSWYEENNIHNPTFSKQKKYIIDVCKNIKKINEIKPIKFILIGISPSFYPAEYWKQGLLYLLKQLKESGLSVDDLIKKVFENKGE